MDERIKSKKYSMTPSENKPTNFRHIAQYLVRIPASYYMEIADTAFDLRCN
jgi:hypothetical protein